MVKLRYITFSGPDNRNTIEEMQEVEDKYSSIITPEIEWGIQFAPYNGAKNLFPSEKWRENLYVEKVNSENFKNLSAHLNGSDCFERFVSYDDILLGELENFERIQLNIESVSQEKFLVKMLEVIKENPDIEYIFPLNKMMKEAFKDYMDSLPKNVKFLFDGSYGAGISPKEWEPALDMVECGYAGGIGPHNVVKVLDEIEAVNEGKDIDTWIDMEGQVRTAISGMDFEKVDLVLQKYLIEKQRVK